MRPLMVPYDVTVPDYSGDTELADHETVLADDPQDAASPIGAFVVDRDPKIPALRLIMTGLALMVPGAIQLLGGFDDGGQLEEWGMFRTFLRYGPTYWVGAESPLNSQTMRPLTLLPAGIASTIDPDSFHGYQLVQAAGLCFQGLGMYLLVCRLGFRRSTGLCSALFFVLFPAWTGLFPYRTSHFHFAAGLLAISAWLLLRAKDRLRPAEIVLMSATGCAALMFHEGFYSIAAFVPLLLLISGGLRRRLALMTVLWFLGPLANGLRILWVLRYGPPQYEEALVTTGDRGVGELPRLFGRVWWAALRAFFDPPFGFRVTLLAGLGVAVIVLALTVTRETAAGPAGLPVRQLAVVGIASVFLMPITSLVYWPYPVHLLDPLRILSVAAFPAAIAVGALIEAVDTRRVAIVVASAVAAIAVFSGVGQRHYWHEVSSFQADVLGTLVQDSAAHGLPTQFVVFDPEQRLGGTYTLLDAIASASMQYLLDDPKATLTICHIDAVGGKQVDPATPCHFDDLSVTLAGSVRTPIGNALLVELRGNTFEVVSAPDGPPVQVPDRVMRTLRCLSRHTCEPISDFRE